MKEIIMKEGVENNDHEGRDYSQKLLQQEFCIIGLIGADEAWTWLQSF